MADPLNDDPALHMPPPADDEAAALVTEAVNPVWRERLDAAPTAPGCYIMVDKAGEIVYVGKAKNLRSRIRQYFQNRTSDSRGFVRLLDRVLLDIRFQVTTNEKDALLLEATLIKEHRPRFNVRIKDDKQYFSLRLDLDAAWPRLQIVRKRARDKALYFGPYASSSAAREMLKLVNRHFRLRDCTDMEFKNRSRPCLRYDMGRCDAPCVLPVDPPAYRDEVRRVRMLMEGRAALLVNELEPLMRAAAQSMEYERAAVIRDRIAAVKRTLEKQHAHFARSVDWDAVGLYREGEHGVVHVTGVRTGRVVGGEAVQVRGRGLDEAAVIEQFLLGWYDGRPIPDAVLLPIAAGDPEPLADVLSERAGRAIEVAVPKRGDKAELVRLAGENAKVDFEARRDKLKNRDEVLQRVQRLLDLPAPPARVECYDVSHFQSGVIVAAQVVFINGEPAKNEYRKYRVKTVGEDPDDFASLHEVLGRRVKRGVEAGNLPDLLVVDGGRGQLAQAVAVLAEFGVRLPCVGLAKARVQHDGDAPAFAESAVERSSERLFVPGRKNPILLKNGTAERHFFERLRDETHRFAVTYQRQMQRKRSLGSALEAVPGVGPRTRRRLVEHFGGVRKLKAAALDELLQVPGLSQNAARSVYRRLHVEAEG